MGNSSSKVGKSGRVLAQNVAKNASKPSTRSTRPKFQEREKPDETDQGGDAAVAERLKKLGQVRFEPIIDNYKPASEDKFTLTLEARQRLEDESLAELEKGGARKLLHPNTITAILASLKEGDSKEQVAKNYKLDPSIFFKLEFLSIPEKPQQQNGPNQLLENNGNATRQPVRRKRRD